MEIEKLRDGVIENAAILDHATRLRLEDYQRQHAKAKIFLDETLKQLKEANAGMEFAKANDVSTSDWDWIIRSIERSIAELTADVEQARAGIASCLGLRYLPKIFS